MKKFIYLFLTRPVTSGMLFLSVIVVGLTAFLNLNIELSPEVEYPQLSVSSSWQGVSPEAVEAYLTSPLESVLSSVKGVSKITSTSSLGSSSIDMEFNPDVNMDFVKIEMSEKINSIKDDLPPGVSPPRISSYVPEDFRNLQGFLTYTLSADVPSNEIRKYINDYLRIPLLSISGISDVKISGGNDREIKISIDFDKAKYFNITNEQISKAVANAQNIQSAGFVKNNGGRNLIKINNEIESINEILDQPVRVSENNEIIRLRDIAHVFDSFSETTSYYRINGKEAVFIHINKEPGYNIVKTADAVYKKIEKLSRNFPPGFIITKEIDKTDFIRDDIYHLYSNAGYSFLIVILILLIIFRRIDYPLIIITSIIFSLLSTFILFYFFEIPLNILTIASITLGFGLMVDNSIVVIDYLDKHYDNRGLKFLTIHVKNIFFPVFASTLTTVAVFIPLLFLTGELKLYFVEFSLAILFSLSSSLVVSFTIIPLMFVKFRFKKNQSSKRNYIVKGNPLYTLLCGKVFKFKKISIFILILFIGLPLWLLPASVDIPVISVPYNFVFGSDLYQDSKNYINLYLGGALNLFFNEVPKGEILNYGEETYLIVSLRLPNGNRLERLNQLTKSFEKEILPYKKQFKNVTANILNPEAAYLRIDFTKSQSNSAFPYILKNYLTAYAVKLGGLNVSVYGFGPGFYSGGYSVSNFSVTVKGYNYLTAKKIAEKFKNIIEKNPRIDNVDIDRSSFYGRNDDRYEIIASINKNNLLRSKIDERTIFGDIAKNTRGNFQYNYFKLNNEEVKYSVKFSNYQDMQLNALRNLNIRGSDSSIAKIKDLVSFEKKKVLSNILREDRQYVRYISFEYKGPYQYGRDFVENSINKIALPPGYSLEKREYTFRFGEEEQIQISKVLLFSIILIFMITASLFESYKKPLLIISAIPFSFIGAIFFFYLFDLSLDRGAYAGLLLLVGLSVNNSIILVDHISKNLQSFNINEIILLSSNRLRAIFTTSLTTAFALIPLMISEENSFWKSLSFSVTGGILISAVLIVLYIPLFYFLLNKKKKAN